MHSHPSHLPLADTLLRQLGSEESLLRDALAIVTEVYAALRRGDLAAARASASEQEALGAALRDAATVRTDSATALAREIGLTGKELTLSAIAEKLPDSLASQVLAARDRLGVVAAELTAIQSRNANLLGYLRSFFRGVLSDLTAPDAPLRYGPSGSRLELAGG